VLDLFFDLLYLPPHEAQHRLDIVLIGPWGSLQAAFFHLLHLQQLVAPLTQRGQCLRLGIGQRTPDASAGAGGLHNGAGYRSTPIAVWLSFTHWRWKFLAESMVALPLVLPPTVLGF
jgi:hypothetical protein